MFISLTVECQYIHTHNGSFRFTRLSGVHALQTLLRELVEFSWNSDAHLFWLRSDGRNNPVDFQRIASIFGRHLKLELASHTSTLRCALSAIIYSDKVFHACHFRGSSYSRVSVYAARHRRMLHVRMCVDNVRVQCVAWASFFSDFSFQRSGPPPHRKSQVEKRRKRLQKSAWAIERTQSWRIFMKPIRCLFDAKYFDFAHFMFERVSVCYGYALTIWRAEWTTPRSAIFLFPFAGWRVDGVEREKLCARKRFLSVLSIDM